MPLAPTRSSNRELHHRRASAAHDVDGVHVLGLADNAGHEDHVADRSSSGSARSPGCAPGSEPRFSIGERENAQLVAASAISHLPSGLDRVLHHGHVFRCDGRGVPPSRLCTYIRFTPALSVPAKRIALVTRKKAGPGIRGDAVIGDAARLAGSSWQQLQRMRRSDRAQAPSVRHATTNARHLSRVVPRECRRYCERRPHTRVRHRQTVRRTELVGRRRTYRQGQSSRASRALLRRRRLAPEPTIAGRLRPCETRMSPAGETSCSAKCPGPLTSLRNRPSSVTAKMEWSAAPAPCAAENQTSLPSGDQATRPTSSKPSARVVFLPCRSTIATPPRAS